MEEDEKREEGREKTAESAEKLERPPNEYADKETWQLHNLVARKLFIDDMHEKPLAILGPKLLNLDNPDSKLKIQKAYSMAGHDGLHGTIMDCIYELGLRSCSEVQSGSNPFIKTLIEFEEEYDENNVLNHLSYFNSLFRESWEEEKNFVKIYFIVIYGANVKPVSEPDENQEHIFSSSSLHKFLWEKRTLFLEDVDINVLMQELYGKIRQGRTADIYDVYSMVNTTWIVKRFDFDLLKRVWKLMNIPALYDDDVRPKAIDALWTCYNGTLSKEQMDILFKEAGNMQSYMEELAQKNLHAGRQEGEEKAALKFIKNGVDIKKASSVTGIPVERLQELVEEDGKANKTQEEA
jgi:hypothetical protein